MIKVVRCVHKSLNFLILFSDGNTSEWAISSCQKCHYACKAIQDHIQSRFSGVRYLLLIKSVLLLNSV